MAKVGRPPAKNPRNIHKNIMLTKAEAAILDDTAKALGISQTAVVVNGILAQYDSIRKGTKIIIPSKGNDEPL